MRMQTVLAFDFGMKSIGVAVGQSITQTASPLPALKARDGIPDWSLIESLISQWQANALIVGLPLNMDGTEQPITANARKFGRRLAHKYNVMVHYQDERLTTVEAKARLFEFGGYKKLSKEKIDSVSAVLIYESWLSEPTQA
ncbi:Holliday junction resolvase RuvX [Glaciecola siphonariae]|uniref:Putative pre-16S rRNA nuclease n=1 Tax=Glaciecola siphonariae TaxID=521012 RepID=A0ABV9LXC4_9ALTE